MASQDRTFYLLTDEAADRRRIVAIDLDDPEEWREVVPQAADTLLEARFFGGRLVCHYLRDACSRLAVFELDGTFLRDITLPAMTTLGGSQIEHELIEGPPESDIVHFAVVSFTEPFSLWSHDLRTGWTALVRRCASALDPAGYVTERARVTSADGTVLPLFLTRRWPRRLGAFPASRRLEQAWLAIHRAKAETAGTGAGAGRPFALFLTLGCPRRKAVPAGPELVKALIDGTVAAFQGSSPTGRTAQAAARIAAATGEQPGLMTQLLADSKRAVLGATGTLVHLRGEGVQWNPADHLCVAAELLITQTADNTWTLSGAIHAVEQRG